MSFECDPCHTIATGKSGFDVHFRPMSRGRCETCGFTADCFECQCPGDWAKARHAANPPTEGKVPNDAPTRHAMWHAEARNELGEKIARIMGEGRYDETYENGAEFHYAIVAALRAPNADHALRSLLDTFAGLQEANRRMVARVVPLMAEAAMAEFIASVKEVDKPGTG